MVYGGTNKSQMLKKIQLLSHREAKVERTSCQLSEPPAFEPLAQRLRRTRGPAAVGVCV
jgi:hypothetical protein